MSERAGNGAAPNVILASRSASRKMLLQQAGIVFEIVKPEFDEGAARAALAGSGATPGDVAEVLARGKAENVSAVHREALVIGGDQILALEERIYEKPAGLDGARDTLLSLRGQTHVLHAAVVLARGGETIWSHVDSAQMTMRDFSPQWLGTYLAHAGEAVCQSVGAYQLEGLGVQLFDEIEGSYFTILGLPLLPLLAALRQEHVLA